jgi:hypothetical protein
MRALKVNEKTIRALVEAGAVKKVCVIANGASLYVDILTQNGAVTATTNKGQIKTWASIDSSVKWLRRMGVGRVDLEISKWMPDQVRLPL